MENRLIDLRENADLRQIDVAHAVGITQRKYSYIETGTQQLTDEILVKLANFYNTSTDYILKMTDEDIPYPKVKDKRRKL